MRGHDRQNPVSNSDVANLNSVVPNCCFIRTEFKRAQQNLRSRTEFRTTQHNFKQNKI
jgi:hypothetical protein